MKKINFYAAMTVCVLLAVFLCSCEKKEESAPETTKLEISMPWSEPEEFEAPVPETQAKDANGNSATTAKSGESDTKAILKRIQDAQKVYDLFYGAKPKMDKNTAVEYEGNTFYKIADPNFASMEKMEKYLSSFFSEDIVHRLLLSGMYVEMEDGSLYAPDISIRLTNPACSDFQVKVVSHTENEEQYSLTMRVDTDGDGKGDETKTCSYTYAKEDKQWVFTHFEMY